MPDRRPKIVYLVSEDWFFLSHRLAMARGAKRAGWDVYVVCRVDRMRERIEQEGFTLVPLALSRASTNPLRALGEVRAIANVYRHVRPDVVHHVAIKLSLLGTLAALVAGVPGVVNSITGLGYLFINDSAKTRTLRGITLWLLRYAMRRLRAHVIVQNRDDLEMLHKRKLVAPERVSLIRGSGVDVSVFVPGTPAEGPPLVTFVGRMLLDKGVRELVEAAELLKARKCIAQVVLVGPTDRANPRTMDDRTLAEWNAEGTIRWLGPRTDIPKVWAESTIAVLPSYREGLPKSLLEAAACGLPLVATDVPGCRELVRHEVDGLLVPPRDPRALADAIERLLDAPELRARYGGSARERVIAEFSQEVIVGQTLAVYEALLGRPPTEAQDSGMR